jgi:hypothetical protein|tara:strand:+ start:79 stop:510 length:432 start_codon:yes stop_codon:yes gene_type:complete
MERKMKSFAKYITEGENTKPFAHAENPSNGYFSEAIIQKINAMMGKIIEEDQQDVDYAVRHIRTSLMKLGLTFDEVPPMMEQSGNVSLPLTLFGGRFGKDLDTPHTEFMSDDGISHQREGGLSLNLTYEMTDTNQYKLRAKIM